MRNRSLVTSLAVALAICLSSASWAQPVQSPPTATGSPAATETQSTSPAQPAEMSSGGYVLGRDDVVEIGLLGRTDFGGRVRVQADGTIQLPFVGKMAASGLTSSELSDAVRKSLQSGGYFSDPVVTVEVVGFASRYVTVLGAVGQPGLIPINRPYRLSEILARVGGARADGADYVVVRSEVGDEKRLLIRDLATGDSGQDPYVQAGDKIFIPLAETFYIYGQVNTPGSFPLQSDMTVRMAVAKGGGLTESGSDKKIELFRNGKKSKVDLASKIEPGDVLVVGERFF